KRERVAASSTASGSDQGDWARPATADLRHAVPLLQSEEINPRPGRTGRKGCWRREARKASLYSRRYFGSRNYDEGASGGRRSLRPSDAPLESEDEGIYLRRTKRYP